MKRLPLPRTWSHFFEREVELGRLTERLLPMQAGIGSIANAVMMGFIDSPLRRLSMYSEVLQDSTFDPGRRAHAARAGKGLVMACPLP